MEDEQDLPSSTDRPNAALKLGRVSESQFAARFRRMKSGFTASKRPYHKNSRKTDSTANAEVETLRSDLDLVRDQVDLLQVKYAEKSGPWYRNPSLLVSAGALVFSIGFGVYTQHQTQLQQTRQDIEAKQEEFRDALEKLVEAKITFVELTQSAPTFERDQVDILVETNRQIQLEKCLALLQEIERLGGNAPISGLLYVGWELAIDGEFTQAEVLYRRALENENSSQKMRIGALSSMASLHSTPGHVLTDHEQARSYWKGILRLLGERTDENAHDMQGRTYLNWYVAEKFNGNDDEAEELLSLAIHEYQKLHPNNPLRIARLAMVEKTRRFYTLKGGLGQDRLIPFLDGDWIINYPNDLKLTGKAVIYSDQVNGGLHIQVDIVRDGLLLAKQTGRSVSIDPSGVRLDWQGATEGPYGPGLIYGSTELGFTDDEGVLRGTELIIGHDPQTVVYRRVN